MAFPVAAVFALLSKVKVSLDVANAAKRVWNSLGSIEDEVSVRVSYNPQANKQAVYYLAAAIGFGLVQRLTPKGFGFVPPPGSIGIEYDAASNEVVFHLKYSSALATVLTFGAGGAALRNIPIYEGPKGNLQLKGGAWSFTGGAAPGGVIGTVPDLPFTGKTTLARGYTCDDPLGVDGTVITPDVRPSGDSRSRGSLVWLVSQALATPAGIPTVTYLSPTEQNRLIGG